MHTSYVFDSGLTFYPEPEDNVMDSIFKQYELVIIESLISSFGLDFIVRDQHGGDVDTIHNVRQIDKDKDMTYKNVLNKSDYDNQEIYNKSIKSKYDSDPRFTSINMEFKKQKIEGTLKDAYTGKTIPCNGNVDLDHVIATKEIHNDRGRVLAGIKGFDLANTKENLKPTDRSINRSMKEKSIEEYCKWLNTNEPKRAAELKRLRAKPQSDLTDKERTALHKYEQQALVNQDEIKNIDKTARKSYESKLAKEYYTSSKFAKDVAFSAGNVGVRMGLRQVLGFIFTEVWFTVKEEFNSLNDSFDFAELLTSIGNGIKRGFENAKVKYKELLAKFKDGVVAGVISSITTTLCNIFFTTAKNVVKIIRQTYASLVQAAKVLFINPNNLSFGERMRAIVKILATGASVVVGTTIGEVIGKTPVGTIPVVGEIIQTFCGTLVTGIMSCSLLYFFDRSEIMNKLVSKLNNLHAFSTEVNYFYQQAEYFEKYAAELMSIDIEKFREETELYYSFAFEVENAKSETELNTMLKNILNTIGVKIPWEGDFDSFMSNKNAVLVFE